MSFSPDALIQAIDTSLRTLFPPKRRRAQRPCPGNEHDKPQLSQKERRHVAGLMRVNHSGEVCAQALYQGQAITARLEDTKEKMAQAAAEEVDHLSWCEQRLDELDENPSVLNPLWYLGSFTIGALAGLAGDKYSLGFVEETERQVTEHLQNHLARLPENDLRSRAILDQMQVDETHHADQARDAGAAPLPTPIQLLMRQVSKIMTTTSYRI